MDLLNLIASLNDSKIFSGIIMIAMNLGSKYISMELNETQEDFLNTKTIRRIIIFAVFFMATRDVLLSVILTIVFILFVGSLFNDSSKFCLIKKKNPKTKLIVKEDFQKAKKIIKKYEKQLMLKHNQKSN